MRIFYLIGLPGSGKSYISLIMKELLENPIVISLGSELREIANNPIDKYCTKANYIIENGLPIPSDLLKEMLEKHLFSTSRDLIFDGFPRDKEQFEIIQEYLCHDRQISQNTIYIDIEQNIARDRLAKRWNCHICNESFLMQNITSYICKKCGNSLTQREDDISRSSIEKRIEVFKTKTTPLLKILKEKTKMLILRHRFNRDEILEFIGA